MTNSRTVNIEIDNTLLNIVMPRLMCASETWTCNEAERSMSQAVEMSYRRGACGMNKMNAKKSESYCYYKNLKDAIYSEWVGHDRFQESSSQPLYKRTVGKCCQMTLTTANPDLCHGLIIINRLATILTLLSSCTKPQMYPGRKLPRKIVIVAGDTWLLARMTCDVLSEAVHEMRAHM